MAVISRDFMLGEM